MGRGLGLDAETLEWLCLCLLFISLSIYTVWGAGPRNEERRGL